MKMKKIFVVLCLLPLSFVASAQSVTMSPYSRYGLGTLAEQSQGFNRGMNGLAQGFRFSNQVNALNPASYSAIDSVTMVFDIGMAGHFTNYKEGDMKKNEKNASFEYAVASFRILKNLGMAVGILPFSNIGYNPFCRYADGLRAMQRCEPCQVRKEAAVSTRRMCRGSVCPYGGIFVYDETARSFFPYFTIYPALPAILADRAPDGRLLCLCYLSA